MGLLQFILFSYLGLCGLNYSDLARIEPPAPLVVTMSDQAQISLYHYPAKESRKPPIILLPEISTNRFIYNLPGAGGLAPFLSRKGRDVWVVEFRGFGNGVLDFGLEEILLYDLPQALARVRAETRQEKIEAVGMGLSGTLLLEYLSSGVTPAVEISKAALINTPSSTQAANGAVKVWAAKAQTWGTGEKIQPVDLMKVCQVPTPWPNIPGTLFHLLFWGPIADEKTEAEVCRSVFLPLPEGLARQLARWVESGNLASRDGKKTYLSDLKNIKTPVLFLSGQLDNLIPPWQVEYAYRAVSSENKKIRIFGRANRYQKEYGHFDLILGRDAFREVYPYILKWLEKP